MVEPPFPAAVVRLEQFKGERRPAEATPLPARPLKETMIEKVTPQKTG